jgi:hypothetical protein
MCRRDRISWRQACRSLVAAIDCSGGALLYLDSGENKTMAASLRPLLSLFSSSINCLSRRRARLVCLSIYLPLSLN